MNTNKRHRKTKRRILMVDDYPSLQRALAHLIDQEFGEGTYVFAETLAEALEAVNQQPFDLAIVDIKLNVNGPDGIGLAEIINSQYPILPVLVFSSHEDILFVDRAFKAGARGYLMKSENGEGIVNAIHQVISGETYISERLAQELDEYRKNISGIGNSET